MIPNPNNSLLGNNGQPTFEQIQQRLAQQVQDNQNPNTAQQLIDLLQQSNAAMGMVPGAGAEADQTLQQLNPTGPQSMQNMQNMRQEIEQERATDEYPFYDEKQLQVDFERQKRAEDKQWEGFISSYKQEMKDKINQEHKNHVTFMTATGGTPLNIGEFAQQTGYLGGNKLQEAWEAHKEEVKNKPPSSLYDDYNQTFLDTMEHRDDFDMERYTDLFHNMGEIQKRISEHHSKGVDNLSDEDKQEVSNLMRSLNDVSKNIDNLSGTNMEWDYSSRNAKDKEAEIHTRNIFPNGFHPSLFDNLILESDLRDYLKQNYRMNSIDVQNVTAEHHLEEMHPDTLNRIKESDLPSGLKNSIINSNSLIPLYEQLTDDIIEAHEAVDYTDGNKGIGNRIHEGLKEKYGFLRLEDTIKQPTISFEKLLYNKFSKSTHQDVEHLKSTMYAFNTHFDEVVHRGKIFPYGLSNGLDYDIFRHLEKVNKEKATINKMFKSPLDYVIDNLIAKANLPILKRQNLTRQYADYLDDMMYNTNPAYSSLRLQTAKHPSPVKGRRLANTENIRFQNSPIFEQRGKKLPLSLDGVPLSGRYVYPNEAFSFNPSFFGGPHSPDLPVSTRHGTVEMQNKLSQQGISNPFSNANPLHLYGFEAGPQRYGKNAQTEGIIYGDLDEANVHRLTNKPYSSREFINVARTLMPQFNRTPAMLSTEKEQDLASTLMNYNIPPVLTDEHLTVDNPNDPMQISSIHDPERQWRSQSQERLLENLEPYKIASEPMDLAMDVLLKREVHPGPYSMNAHDYTMPTNLHPDWDKWVDEFMDDGMQDVEGWTQNDMNFIAGSQSREEFFKRANKIVDYQMNDAPMEEHEHQTNFRNVPFNEETGFTRSEPMDIAMQLLKRDRIYDPDAENKGQEGIDWHPGEEGVDWDSSVESSLDPRHDLEQRHPNDPDMQEYDRHAQELLGLMVNRDIAHLQGNEKPMTEDEQFDLMDARQKLQASIPKNTHFASIQNAVGYDKDGNKTSTFGDGRPKFNEGSPRYQKRIGDRPTVPIYTEGSFYGVPYNEETHFTTGEPMDLAIDALLKLELAPPMAQGIEEQIPMQEDTPMIDVSMGDYKTPCECAEEIRQVVLSVQQKAIDIMAEMNSSPQDPKKLEYVEKLQTAHFESFGRMEDWYTMSCEEILQWVESTNLYHYKDMLEQCQSGMNESDQMKYTGEPMDLAMDALLKEARPHALIPNFDLYSMLNPKSSARPKQIKTHFPHATSEDEIPMDELATEREIRQRDTDYFPLSQTQSDYREKESPPIFANVGTDKVTYDPYWQDVLTGEPMDLVMDVLLKDRISPEAKQHKLEYDKKYESSPERVKYREELNRERRNRGIYGKHNHMDVSHTEGGKLTLESEHGNRARHFKEKGTLRHEE